MCQEGFAKAELGCNAAVCDAKMTLCNGLAMQTTAEAAGMAMMLPYLRLWKPSRATHSGIPSWTELTWKDCRRCCPLSQPPHPVYWIVGPDGQQLACQVGWLGRDLNPGPPALPELGEWAAARKKALLCQRSHTAVQMTIHRTREGRTRSLPSPPGLDNPKMSTSGTDTTPTPTPRN